MSDVETEIFKYLRTTTKPKNGAPVMLYIKTLDQGRNLLKALGSDIRIDIIKCLLKNKAMNMNELASKLNITN